MMNIKIFGIVQLVDMIKVILGDGTLGYPQKNETEMYDRIIVTAASPNIPEYLIKQMNLLI